MPKFGNSDNLVVNEKRVLKTFDSPSLIRFLRPNVPILSQNDSSLSFLLIIGRGDLDLGDAIFDV